ncbi:MAG: hypothetical protein ABSC38_02315 [Verrucomicrobiia bacterium]
MSKANQPLLVASNDLTQRQILGWAFIFGLLTILIHLPFLFRFDLYFQSGIAPGYLIPKRMLSHGEFPIYTWGTDYGGIGPSEFLAAGLFALFGPSIPLASFVSLLTWACGVGLLVVFAGRYWGRGAAIGAGVALAIGVPFYLMYNSQPFLTAYSTLPLYIGGFLWLTILILRRGPRTWLCPLTGLIMGWFWYAHKHVIVVWLAAGIALVAMPEGRGFLRSFVRSRMLWLSVAAFLVGYSPELLYKMGVISHENRTEDVQGFLNFATPGMMARNWYMLFRCLPTYVDADPWSRQPCSTHYLNHMENWESVPLSAVDTVGIIVAALLIPYGIRLLRESYREKNLPVFLFNMIAVVDLVLMIVAAKSAGSYYSIRRYLLPASVVLLVWLGVRLSAAWQARQWVVIGVLVLWLGISAFHQWQMLQGPDELADYRRTAKDIVDAGYQYGISWYSYSHTLTALSDERVKFGILDFSQQSPYQTAAFTQEVVAVVWPASRPPPFEFAQKQFFGGVRIPGNSGQVLEEKIQVLGHEYTRIAPPRIIGELGWAPYRMGQAVLAPSSP